MTPPSRSRRDAPALTTVVVPVYNGAATLGEELEALSRQTYAGAWEVLVVDNGSTDATVEVARSYAEKVPGLRIVDASSIQGSSHARNVGARQARGSFLAFCDADDVVADEWLDGLVDAGRDHDLVGGVQDSDALNDERVRTWRSPRTSDGLAVALGFLPFTGSGNLGVWTDVYLALGGLRPSYPQAHDVEFSWRAQLAGYDLGFAPDAVLHYRFRSTMRGVARQAYLSALDAVQLYRDYRDAGMPGTRTVDALRTWAWLVARSPMLLDPARRGTWVRRAAGAYGRAVGSARYRARYL